MKNLILTTAIAAILGLAAEVQAQFKPGHLAVLRAGDGSVDLHLKQAPIFVDQFDPAANNSAPSFTVAIPTNGPNALFFNGHAATEGNLTRSADHTLLAFAGYCGVNLLASNGTPSLLEIPRGFGTIDASGVVHMTMYHGTGWVGKMNPRGIVTDGVGNFWGCGNAYGTLYFSPSNGPAPVKFESIPNTRAIKIINNVLYATLNRADGVPLDKPAGIYGFTTGSGTAESLPREADTGLLLLVEAEKSYKGTVAFDVNPAGTVAYMADTAAGVQKYVKTGDAWKFACNFTIPQNIPADANRGTGCFGLAVDFSGATPIIYATTTEGWGGSANSNRVVRIVDNGEKAAVTTVAQATSTNMVFRGLDFTPESKPAAAKP